MNGLYPPESQRLDFVGHLAELRRRIILTLLVFLLACGFLCAQGYGLIALLELPAQGLIKDFIFIDPTEAFMAYVKAVLMAGLIVCFPVAAYQVWAFVTPALPPPARRAVLVWVLLSLVCFYGGIIFAYGLLLPAAVNFLVGFGEGIARPAITISRYISFASLILVAGGLIFQIPVVAGILTEAGLVDARKLCRVRRQVILLLVIIAAVVSPTQDLFNLALFAGPMVALYEVGIILSWMVGRRKARVARG